jgi:hypothetical protein
MNIPCPGCERQLPMHNGMHVGELEMISCTRTAPLTLEPKTRDIWHQPAKRKLNAAPFTAGDEV